MKVKQEITACSVENLVKKEVVSPKIKLDEKDPTKKSYNHFPTNQIGRKRVRAIPTGTITNISDLVSAPSKDLSYL